MHLVSPVIEQYCVMQDPWSPDAAALSAAAVHFALQHDKPPLTVAPDPCVPYGACVCCARYASCVCVQVNEQFTTYTATDVAEGLQDFLICIEMFIAALAHAYAFPPRVRLQHWLLGL